MEHEKVPSVPAKCYFRNVYLFTKERYCRITPAAHLEYVRRYNNSMCYSRSMVTCPPATLPDMVACVVSVVTIVSAVVREGGLLDGVAARQGGSGRVNISQVVVLILSSSPRRVTSTCLTYQYSLSYPSNSSPPRPPPRPAPPPPRRAPPHLSHARRSITHSFPQCTFDWGINSPSPLFAASRDRLTPPACYL